MYGTSVDPLTRYSRLIVCGNQKIAANLDSPLISNVRLKDMQDNEQLLKPNREGKFPVVIFSHGRGGQRNMYSSICCDLASRGFVVASVEHRDGSASATYTIENGKEKVIPYRKIKEGEDEFSVVNPQVEIRTQEVLDALDLIKELGNSSEHFDKYENLLESSFDFSSFKGKLDLTNVAIAGHSFGAATVVNTLAESHIFKWVCNSFKRVIYDGKSHYAECGICLDIWTLPLKKEKFQLVREPMAFINSETFHWRKNIIVINEMNDSQPEADRPLVTILGSNHYTASDVPFVFPDRLLKWFGLKSELCPYRGMQLHREVTWEFLKKHLDITDDAVNEAILSGGDNCPKEILIGTNVDI